MTDVLDLGSEAHDFGDHHLGSDGFVHMKPGSWLHNGHFDSHSLDFVREHMAGIQTSALAPNGLEIPAIPHPAVGIKLDI